MNHTRTFTRRLFNATWIAVLLFALVLGGPSGRASAAVETVRVPADAGWVATGIWLEQYRPASIETHGQALTGKISLLPEAKSGPAGQLWNDGCGAYEGAPPPCAMDGEPYGALVGKIGLEGDPFYIGDQEEFVPETTGELYLAVNDNLEFYADNRGGFTVLLHSGNLAGGYIAAFPDWELVEGRYWTPGAEVTLKIFSADEGLLYEDTQVAGDNWLETNVFFDLAAQGFDLAPGQRVRLSGGGYIRVLRVSPVALTGFSIQDAQLYGVCDPAIFCWAHLDDRDAYAFEVAEDGSWTAYFYYLNPLEEGWVFQWDDDGDETRRRFVVE